jgi:hypothetical protein
MYHLGTLGRGLLWVAPFFNEFLYSILLDAMRVTTNHIQYKEEGADTMDLRLSLSLPKLMIIFRANNTSP